MRNTVWQERRGHEGESRKGEKRTCWRQLEGREKELKKTVKRERRCQDLKKDSETERREEM